CRLHQRIAETLDDGSDDPERVYGRARHYARGEADRTPAKVFASGLAAGRLALADHAPAEAMDFLERAAAAADAAGITPDAAFHLAVGAACSRTGRFVEALGHLDRALAAVPDRLGRAGVLAEIAWVHASAWDPGRCWETVCAGMAELGRPVPRGKLALVLTTLLTFLAGLVVGVTKIGYGSAV